MAGAYFKSLCEKSARADITVESAGTFAGEGELASAQSVAVMKDYGIDLSGHRSSTLTKGKIDSADLIVAMTSSHRHHIGSISPSALKKTRTLLEFTQNNGNISDPFGGTEKIYSDCFEEMKDALDNLFLEVITKKKKD
jgi:protein-tyrosine-phosphatase